MNPFNFFYDYFGGKLWFLKQKFIDHPYALRAAIKPYRTLIKNGDETNRIIQSTYQYYGLMYWALLFGARKRIVYWLKLPYFKFKSMLWKISVRLAPKTLIIPKIKRPLFLFFFRNPFWLRFSKKFISWIKKRKLKWRYKMRRRSRRLRKRRLKLRALRYISHVKHAAGKSILQSIFFSKPKISFWPLVLAFFYVHLYSDYYSLIKDIDITRDIRLEPYRLLNEPGVSYELETLNILKANFYFSSSEHDFIRYEITYIEILKNYLLGIFEDVKKYI